MKRLKYLVLALLLSASALCGAGCSASESLPDYEADKDELAVHFAGLMEPPPENYYKYDGSDVPNSPSYITLERYQEMKECGIDIIIAHGEQKLASENVMKSLEYAAQTGVKYITQYQDVVNLGNSTPERMEAVLGDILSHDACYGIVVKDEPSAKQFNSLARAYRVFDQIEAFKDKCFYINLLPTYGVGDMTYEQYIEEYCQKVGNRFISVDHYPYDYDGLIYETNQTWLMNLETVQNACIKYGLDHWEYLQGTKAWPSSKIPDYYDLSQQIYISMSYGATVMEYYCYFTPAEFGPNEELRCLIDYYGNRTDIYDAAKKINNEILAFDHVYMNFVDGWQGVMTYIGSENEREYNSAFNMLQTPLEKHDRIKSVQSEQDLVVAAFEDKDGYDGFIMTNYAIPGLRLSSEVSVTFNNATQAVVYRKGEQSVVELNKGTLDLTLDPGEGVFVIPVNVK